MKNTNSSHILPNQSLSLLGGLSVEQFLAEYWQKKPLLIRQAIPGFSGLLSPDELAGLACEEEVQSRLISFKSKRWHMESGPFDEARFSQLPERDWTLLVQGVNHHMSEAAALLQQFSFIPHARLDDLMVSFAPDMGGVGPHFDSYDVFLLQGEGKRLWRISEQEDLSLVEGAPLRILQNFSMEQEWVLEPGDMLYLPPHVAHWGIAVGSAMTYSIGFRAPAAQELAGEFLNYLQDKLKVEGMYADPELQYQEHPAEISNTMLEKVSTMLNQVRWQPQDVAAFLGRYLSEPKPHVIFDAADHISLKTFRQQLPKHGIVMSGKSQMLFHEAQFFMNGEQFTPAKQTQHLWTMLADQRQLPAYCFDQSVLQDDILIQQLYDWYLAGYLYLNK
ncbi:50S ribosomal protein L16 3-hydroxylase [Methylobacillus rhizosphaerae]|uniref:50S ribosomal protein L16 3-hydroxylase n=1 Tax=Methylobacillus rhizosphaerae TaxID=551994 RepID=A0A238YZT7_9PROT|nr:cupin domain-containing protein [Methylobacillus rhizosphaerae]SNR76676.1 50S ribosomal protein L16 3-hydroxylase [Methylobacillus rhizosphaerae]